MVPFHRAEVQRHFGAVHQRRENPEEITEVMLAAGNATELLAKVIVGAGLASSNAEARRLLQQGGVKVDGEVVRDPQAVVPAQTGSFFLVQVGKRRFARIRFE